MRIPQRLLLLGSSGYLGRTLTTLMLEQPVTLFPTYRTTTLFPQALRYDFWRDDLADFVREQKIDAVIMAANMAYEAVDPLFDGKLYRRRVNQLVQACMHCRFIYISSDGIFDGRQGAYTESDPPHPTTPYGQNLHFFEARVREFCENYCIIRPSYLYGYSLGELDRRLRRVREGLLQGEHFEYFDDMLKSPLDVNQAAQAIVQLALSNFVGIVHVAGKPMSVYHFYQAAMQALGVPVEHLHPISMPPETYLPRDTTLRTRLMKGLTGIEPLEIAEALTRYAPVSLKPLEEA